MFSQKYFVKVKTFRNICDVSRATSASTLFQSIPYRSPRRWAHWSCQSNRRHHSRRTLRPRRSPAACNLLEVRGCRNFCYPVFLPKPISPRYRDIESRRRRTTKWSCRIRWLLTVHICSKDFAYMLYLILNDTNERRRKKKEKIANISFNLAINGSIIAFSSMDSFLKSRLIYHRLFILEQNIYRRMNY